MERTIRESDWKIFKQLRELALDRYCQRVLEELTRIAASSGQSHHERYLAVYRLIQRRDDELADTFNDPRRSRAVIQLARIQWHGLLTEDEFARFGAETRDEVQFLLDIAARKKD